MESEINKLNQLLTTMKLYLTSTDSAELRFRPMPEKWSKQEILGHLIDSGINNLQRFTEIQYFPQPYLHRPYKQAELVKANDYQNSDTKELLMLWLALNARIIKIIDILKNNLELNIQLTDGEIIDLRFLISDYVEHMEWHANQILPTKFQN